MRHSKWMTFSLRRRNVAVIWLCQRASIWHTYVRTHACSCMFVYLFSYSWKLIKVNKKWASFRDGKRTNTSSLLHQFWLYFFASRNITYIISWRLFAASADFKCIARWKEDGGSSGMRTGNSNGIKQTDEYSYRICVHICVCTYVNLEKIFHW